MRISRPPLALLIPIVCFVTAAFCTASGAEPALPRPLLLDSMLITATRLEEENFHIPYACESIDEEALTTGKAFRTLPEALKEVPGVMVQQTGHGQGSPYIRGFTGYRTLLLIDGIRLNNSVFRDGPNQYWNTIDTLTIERLEVVKGPGSVLYGSDAIGGTVNARTRTRLPEDPSTGAPGLTWERRGYWRYASAEQSHAVRAEISGAQGPHAGFIGGVSYRDFGDLSGGRHMGVMPNTGYDDLAGDAKAMFRLRPGVDLTVAMQAVTQDRAPRTHSTIYGKSYRGTAVGTDLARDLDQERYLTYARLDWTPEDMAWLEKAQATLSYHVQRETEVRTRSDLRSQRQGFDVGTLGASVQLESPSPLGTWTYGLEYYRDDVDSFYREYNADGTLRGTRPRGPVADDASYDMLGVYVQNSLRPIDRLEVTVGGRFTTVAAAADKVDPHPDPGAGPDIGRVNERFTGVVGSLRARYDVLDVWNVFGGVSQGFRAPNLSDLTRFDVARSGEVETPAPDLKAEKTVSFEMGSKVRLDAIGLQGYAAYHCTLIDGMIVRYPTGALIDGAPEVTKKNVGDGLVHGAELGLAWGFYDGFTAFGNVAWLKGDADTYVGDRKRRRPMSRIQPAQALLGLRWESPSRTYAVETTVMIAGKQDRLSPGDVNDVQRIPAGGTPGYTIYALRGSAEVFRGTRVFAAVENITDRDYRVHGSGLNGPGTNAILGVDCRF